MTGDARNLAIVAVLAIAPIALIAVVALLRGYSIDLHMTRHRRREGDEDE